jgi:Capsular polysaccharide biosynthesis protein
MDPLTILRTLWHHKWVALPFVVLTLMAGAYVYYFAPRTYDASVSYALTAPDLPTEHELETNTALATTNANNPYLRSADSSLLSQVVIAKMSDPLLVESLKERGLGTDFKIAPVASLGLGLVDVTVTADSEATAVTTAQVLGEQFTKTIQSVQKVNGADNSYLYEPILVRGPGPAQEQFSSRLRSLIMVGIVGAIVIFGAVSVAQSVTVNRKRWAEQAKKSDSAGEIIAETQSISPRKSAFADSSGPRSRTGRKSSRGDTPRRTGADLDPHLSTQGNVRTGAFGTNQR